MEPKQRIQVLTDALTDHQYRYYVLASPTISDAQYDALFDELLHLEQQHPELKRPDSPSQRVGSDLDQTFPQRTHLMPILSLDKANTASQIQDWIKKITTSQATTELIMEDKIDGLSIILYYQEGVLQYALTRGDGERGNDITENVKTIRQIPLRISFSDSVIVRGEVYLQKNDFAQLNSTQEQRFANPRNLAAGSIRQSHSSQVAKIPLKFVAHDAHFPTRPPQNHLQNLFILQNEGFLLIQPLWFLTERGLVPTVNLRGLQAHSFHELPLLLEEIRQTRHTRPYEIDGMVLKVNQHQIRTELGLTSHHPRWAMAFKFDAPTAETRLLSIDIQVGRNGRITPVANLEPVLISGSTVSRATLHNQQNIDTLQIGPGDWVTVSKRGDVIPAVEEVVKKSADNPSIFTLPDVCPVCQTPLEQVGAHHFCQNRTCPERMQKQIIYFVAKSQMDIVGLGEQTIRRLFGEGHIQTIPDLYLFDYNKLLGQVGFGEKKIANICESLQTSKKRPFSAVLAALGIEGIGPQVVKLLIDSGLDSMNALLTVVKEGQSESLSSIAGMGPVLAKNLSTYLGDPLHLQLIKTLADIGLNMKEENRPSLPVDGPFLGQSWVITGSFIHFQPREKAAELIRQNGGLVLSAITAKTSHLLAGDKPGSKLEKAQQMGITIVSEAEFIALTGSK